MLLGCLNDAFLAALPVLFECIASQALSLCALAALPSCPCLTASPRS